jgi:hypothetical protein
VSTLTTSQINKLGERLRRGTTTDTDLLLLDEYRRSFAGAFNTVVRSIRRHLSLEVNGRPANTTGAIIEKLVRERTRLSHVQDIAGCRIVVAGIEEQDLVLMGVSLLFPGSSVIDRRRQPSHGYRAVTSFQL